MCVECAELRLERHAVCKSFSTGADAIAVWLFFNLWQPSGHCVLRARIRLTELAPAKRSGCQLGICSAFSVHLDFRLQPAAVKALTIMVQRHTAVVCKAQLEQCVIGRRQASQESVVEIA